MGDKMKKVMFVCTGNICRSAMAHRMLEKKIEEEKLDLKAYSCGIYAENGDTSTYNAIEVMEEYGVNLKKHRAINIKDSNIEEMDIILCMTISHKISILQMYPKLKEKVFTLKEYVGMDNNGKDKDISDPWMCSLSVYRNCASQIEECLNKLTEKIEK